jgi:hypothetical protein
MTLRVSLWILLCSAACTAIPQTAVNPDAQIQKDFDKRIQDYVKLCNTAREGLHKLKPTQSADTIQVHEKGLAHRIRELRRNAAQGDIFTPDIATEFRRLIGMTMQGQDATRVHKSLERAEPVHLQSLRVNRSYPEGVPLQSTPATLLQNLPKLPKELEYRVVGRALVLRDTEANLIVDFISDAIPVRTNAP